MKKRFQVTSFYTESLNGQLNLVEGVDGIISITPPAIQDNKDFYMIIDPLNKTGDRLVIRCFVSGGVINYYGWSFFGNHTYFEGTDIQINDVAELFNTAYQHIDDFGFVEDIGGLDVIVRGGRVVNASLADVSISDQELTLPDNSTSYIYFDNTDNTFKFSATKKLSYLSCARVVTLAGVITTIEDLRANWIGVGTEMQRLTQTEINAIPDKRDGMMVFNTTAGLPQYYAGGFWFDISSGTVTPRASETVEGKVRVQTDEEFDNGDDIGSDDATLVSKPSKVKEKFNEIENEIKNKIVSGLSNEGVLAGESISRFDSLFIERIGDIGENDVALNHGIALNRSSGTTSDARGFSFITKKSYILKSVIKLGSVTATRARITVGGIEYFATFSGNTATFSDFIILSPGVSYTILVDNSGANYAYSYGGGSYENTNFYIGNQAIYNITGLVCLDNTIGDIQSQNIGSSASTQRYCTRIIFSGQTSDTIDMLLSKEGTPILDLNIRIESDNNGLPSGNLIKPGYLGTISEGLLTTKTAKKTITFGSNICEDRGTIGWLVFSQGPAGGEVTSADNYYKLGVSTKKSNTRFGMTYNGSVWSFGGIQQNGLFTNYYEDLGGYKSATDSSISWSAYNQDFSATYFQNGYRTTNTITTPNIFASAIMTNNHGAYTSSGTTQLGMFLYYDSNNYIKMEKYSLRSGSSTFLRTRVDIIKDGVSVYFFETGQESETMRNRISKVGNNISFHQRTGSSWTQIGVTQTVVFAGSPKLWYSANGYSNPNNTHSIGISNPIISPSTYTTMIPILTDNMNIFFGNWFDRDLLAKTSALYAYMLPKTPIFSLGDYDVGNLVKYSGFGEIEGFLGQIDKEYFVQDSYGQIGIIPGTLICKVGETSKSENIMAVSNLGIGEYVELANNTTYYAGNAGIIVTWSTPVSNESSGETVYSDISSTPFATVGFQGANNSYNSGPCTVPIPKGNYFKVVDSGNATFRTRRFYRLA